MFSKRNSSSHRNNYPKIVTTSPKILKDKNNGYVNINKKNNINRKTTNITQFNSCRLFLSNIHESKNDINHCSLRHTITNNSMNPFKLTSSIISGSNTNSITFTRNNMNYMNNTDYINTENEKDSTYNLKSTRKDFVANYTSPIQNKIRQSKYGFIRESPITLNKYPNPLETEQSIHSEKKFDYNIISKATDKLNNLIVKKKEEENKRNVSYDKHIIQIATNKLQNIFENNTKKRNDNSLGKTTSKSKRKKKRMKSANKYYTILNQQNTLDKILRLESIISKKKTKKDSSNTITTVSQTNKIYNIDYLLSFQQTPICKKTSNLSQPLLNHFDKYRIYEEESNKNIIKRKDYSNEIKQAEEFVIKLEEKRQLDPIKYDLTELLNMLTVDNYKEIQIIIYDTIHESVENQIKFLEVLFQKAINEKAFVPLYAKLCKDLDKELPQRIGHPKKKILSTSIMRNKLVDKCKEIFSIENTSQINEYIKVKDPEEREFKTKRFVLGNVNFIGELIAIRLLTKKIWYNCIRDLFSRYENKDEEDKLKLIDLEGIIIFTDKFGTLVNNQKNKIKKCDLNDYIEQIDDTLIKLEQIQKRDKLPGFVKYKIINLLEKKKGGWEETKFEKNSIAKGKENVKREFEEFLID
jgi:hypothetical protein